MIRNITATIRFVPLAISLLFAIAGAFIALIGGVAGWETVASLGKSAAGLGSLAFFVWLCLPILISAF
jgi:hypothetical protein